MLPGPPFVPECRMDVESQIEVIDTTGRRMAEVLRDTDLEQAVPSCPGWTTRELVRHLGGVHRWATVFVSTGRTTAITEDRETLAGGWPPDETLLEWFEQGYQSLTEALRAAPADLDCWTFLASDSPRQHWARRQAHETAIHRVDAELAVASPVLPFDPTLAADGVDEYLTAFIERPGRGPRSEDSRSFSATSTDTGHSWTVYYDSKKSTTKRMADPEADVSVLATASDLYLWVWRRLHRDAVNSNGRSAVIDDWNTIQPGW